MNSPLSITDDEGWHVIARGCDTKEQTQVRTLGLTTHLWPTNGLKPVWYIVLIVIYRFDLFMKLYFWTVTEFAENFHQKLIISEITQTVNHTNEP